MLNKKMQYLILALMLPLGLLANDEPKELLSKKDSVLYASGAKLYLEDIQKDLTKERAYRKADFFIGKDKEDVINWNANFMSFFMHGLNNTKLDIETEYAMTQTEAKVFEIGELYRENKISELLSKLQADFTYELDEASELDSAKELIYQGISDASTNKLIMKEPVAYLKNTIFVYKYEVDINSLKEREIAFLEKNRKMKGVKVLPSGVQYKVEQKGKGIKPTVYDSVRVDYEGKLLDGTVFDSSSQRGRPSTFAVESVIMGWVDVLPMMSKGAKWTVVVPYKEGYGEQEVGKILPYSTLLFEIELLEVIPRKED